MFCSQRQAHDNGSDDDDDGGAGGDDGNDGSSGGWGGGGYSASEGDGDEADEAYARQLDRQLNGLRMRAPKVWLLAQAVR
jgi:hypothetical protein